jgi:hypothetical protein
MAVTTQSFEKQYKDGRLERSASSLTRRSRTQIRTLRLLTYVLTLWQVEKWSLLKMQPSERPLGRVG